MLACLCVAHAVRAMSAVLAELAVSTVLAVLAALLAFTKIELPVTEQVKNRAHAKIPRRIDSK